MLVTNPARFHWFFPRKFKFAFSHFLCLSVFIGTTIFVSAHTYADDQAIQQTDAKLQSLARDVSAIKKSQSAILETQDQIIEEIKDLKVWANKHR